MTTNKNRYESPRLHLLAEGRALCGLAGIPRDWAPGHFWVGADEPPIERASANCAACLAAQ